MIIGREKEIATLRGLLTSDESQFVAVYGRRRVGKTFLIREAYNYEFVFQHTGTYGATRKQQLSDFRDSLYNAGMGKCVMPKNWSEAFRLLWDFLKGMPVNEKKKIIFIDELPWMDTPKSNFVYSLDHFWNAWATDRKDLVLIVCGSATSWIVKKIINNHGGLHNRLTHKIHLQPFCLNECEQMSENMELGLSRYQLLQAYMVFGGIPYYWSLLDGELSLSQNIDNLIFNPDGELADEFNMLYASLFDKPESYIKVVETLTKKQSGLTREEIVKLGRLSSNGKLSRIIQELEWCGFIRTYKRIGQKKKDAIIQLTDLYTLFYYQVIRQGSGDDQYWSHHLLSGRLNSWMGRAFERVCLWHIPQIKDALGIEGIACNVYSWYVRGTDSAKGAQIDLLLERADNVISLCEMKFAEDDYSISSAEGENLRRRRTRFIEETGTKDAVQYVLVTTYGLSQGKHSHLIQRTITMDKLFLPPK